MILPGRYGYVGVAAAALQLAVCLAATRAHPRVVVTLTAQDDDGLLGKPLEHYRNIIRSMAAFKGELYVGTYGQGLFVFPLPLTTPARPVRHLTHANSPLAENRINCLEVLG